MIRQVQCCAPDDTLEQAAQLMWDRDCGSLPVCAPADGASDAIGVITDRDICMCALFEHRTLAELRVSQAMAKKVLTCELSDSIEKAESLMRSGRVRRLLVTDPQGHLAGMISLADLARRAAQERGSARQETISESEVGRVLAAIVTPQGQSSSLSA